MNDTPRYSRREFFRLSCQAMASAALVAYTGQTVLAGKPPLDDHTRTTLVGVFRTLYPHQSLSDERYVAVLQGLMAKAGQDPKLTQVLQEGVAHLDGLQEGPWLDQDAETRLSSLRAMAGTPFLTTVAGEPVVGLYNQPEVWEALGYEGPSYPQGGYIHRGFDDLDWLPNPPEAASPSASS